MSRSTFVVGGPGFIADHKSMEQNTGRQIDWTNVAGSYVDADTGKKVIPAGTPVGELLGAGKISPRVVTTNPATGLLATTAVEDAPEHAKTGYGVYVGGVVYENFLPTSSGSPTRLAAAVRTELDTAGCTFKWEYYEDNRT
jgi:hypothetical protein